MIPVPLLSELGFKNFENLIWREGQAEVVSRIINSDKEYVLLQAPTGVGKSLIAFGSIFLGEHFERQSGPYILPWQSSILTATIQLQRQYYNDFMDVAKEVKGRRNFDCLIEPVTADEATCTFKNPRPSEENEGCDAYWDCPYYEQRRKAEVSKSVIQSYAMGLTSMNYTNSFTQQSLLVLDEGHLIDDMLMSFISSSIGRVTADKFNIKVPPEGVNWTWDGWQQWAEAYEDSLTDKLEAMEGRLEVDLEARKLYKAGNSMLDAMQLLQHNKTSWVIEPTLTGWEFKPVWVGSMAYDKLYKHGHKKLLMSATILNPTLFASIHGIPPEATEFIDVPSSFPTGQKPVYYDPVGNIKGGRGVDGYQELAKAVEDIVRSHPTEKGLIHCVSYQIMNAILKYVSPEVRKRLVHHSSVDRLAVYETFKSSTEPVVLLSPSMKEGVSLEDDTCRFVIVTKMPYPYLGSPQVAARMKTPLGKEWYVFRTMADLIQMTGRGMRNEKDWCVVYILDSNFTRLFQQMRRWIPSYWLDDLRDVRGLLKL